MTVVINLVLVVAGIGLAYLNRTDEFVVAVTVGVATLSATILATKLSILEKGFIGPTLLSGTLYRRAPIRVSIAYLIAIPVDGVHLLVRGQRITTQFQPVGGVFKSYLSEPEMLRRFRALPDTRFAVDQRSKNDLRLQLPGRNLYKLLRWFKSRQDRELFPFREFYEELVRPGILDQDTFGVFDCKYHGLRHLPLRFNSYSQCQQLIVAEVYELRPTEAQLAALRTLRDSGSTEVFFANADEIVRGGVVSAPATFDLAPTTRWLID